VVALAPEPGVTDDGLPFVDEHRVLVDAPADAVWRVLAHHSPRRRPAAEAFARVLGAEPGRTSGEPFAPGSTIPGFRVAETDPGRRLRLAGRHRFSRYVLEFTVAEGPDGTTLSARTLAEFPGVRGRTYRRVVIGSGAHRVVVDRMLRGVRRRAQQERGR
jgi:hypothetical protein